MNCRNSILFGLSLIFLFLFSCKKDSVDESTNGKTTAVFNSSLTYGTLTDQEGNIYKTITIGNQTWMAENLRTTCFNDGSPISQLKNSSDWIASSSSAYCNPLNTSRPDSIASYGRLYNWHAVSSGKLAPQGWHVPTILEWQSLFTALGGMNVAATKLMEAGTTHWSGTNSATNASGMTILPAGYRDFGGAGKFINFQKGANFWTSSPNDSQTAQRIYFNINDAKGYAYIGGLTYGFSVRCVKN